MAALVAVLPFAAFAEDPAAAPKTPAQLLESKAPSIVSIKCVLKVQLSLMGQSQEMERNKECRGVVVSARGLVLTANSNFEAGGAAGGAIGQMLGGQIEMKAVPSDVRVMFGNEVEEHPAALVARDSNLDIAFVQILDLGEKQLPFVSLAPGGAKPEIGAELYVATRLGRAFDCAPSVGKLAVTASLDKPRRMWAVSGDFMVPGHPVFDLAGQPMGVLSVQQGSEGVDEGGEDGGLGALFAAGDLQDSIQLVVLPLEEVHKQYQAAEKRAEEAIAAHLKGEDKPTEEAPPAEAGNPAASEKPPELPKPPEQPTQPDVPK